MPLFLKPTVKAAPTEKYLMIIHTAIFLMLDNAKEFVIDSINDNFEQFYKNNKENIIQLVEFINDEYDYVINHNQLVIIVNGFLSQEIRYRHGMMKSITYGFKYHINSMNDGIDVPNGNKLQWIEWYLNATPEEVENYFKQD